MTYPGLLYPPVYPGTGSLVVRPPRPDLWDRPALPDLTGWRFIATRLNGDGTETPLDFNVPIQDLTFREDLSGPGAITGTISPEIPRLQADEWFLPRSTAIYVEESGLIRAGAFVNKRTVVGAELSLDCVGFTGFAVGEPYKGVRSRVGVDPMDEFRHIWAHIQGQQGKDLGIVWDNTTSGLKVGTPPEDVNFQTGEGEDVSFASGDGPFKLNWWSTDDLGAELDKLADRFDYGIVHAWDGDTETILHRGVLGYPQIGARLDNRIVVGENIFVEPQIDYHGDMYASEVVVLGSGEGRDMRRGSAQRSTGRLGRTVTISDDSLTSNEECRARARRELKLRLGDPDVSSIELVNHPHAPTGSVNVGDQIRVQTPHGWDDGIDLWVRVLSKSVTPESDRTVLDVARVERV